MPEFAEITRSPIGPGYGIVTPFQSLGAFRLPLLGSSRPASARLSRAERSAVLILGQPERWRFYPPSNEILIQSLFIGSVAMSGTRSLSPSYACDIAKPLAGHVAAGLIALFAVLAGSERASALSKEQAIDNCRQTVGAPNVRACMQGMGKGGDREANLATCRAGVLPKMKACVMAALNAANGRANVAIEIYKNGKPKADAVAPGNALPAGFVAPPRTIADITAILDSEKPHPATLAKLKASADNEPGKNISQADLAEFYIERGTARSALGRNMEALADGEKALAAALASGDGYFGQRIRQFITLQKLALGDIKGALQISQFMIKDANRPGQKGYLFNAQRIAANILVQM